MSNVAIVVEYITDIIFLATNILLLHIFLNSRRPYWLTAMVFAVAGVAIHWLRLLLEPAVPNFLLRGFLTGPLYLIPCVLLFKERFPAIVFVFFLIYSLTQLIYLIFMHVDQFLSPDLPGTWVLLGLSLELISLPLINKYISPHIKNIVSIINRKNLSFTLFPILSFILLAFYGVQGTYALSTFIPLVLSTILIFFSYHLIALSLGQSRRHQQMELVARTDSLTGIYNRRHMEQSIQQEYELFQRTGAEFAVVLADINLFKELNDMYGHDCGDRLLKSLSEDLQKSIRKCDTVARWGGDEFLLLLPETNAEEAVRLAERMRKTVEERTYVYENEAMPLTITLGVSVVRRGDAIATVIKNADMALYEGKRAGRNCVRAFDGAH